MDLSDQDEDEDSDEDLKDIDIEKALITDYQESDDEDGEPKKSMLSVLNNF